MLFNHVGVGLPARLELLHTAGMSAVYLCPVVVDARVRPGYLVTNVHVPVGIAFASVGSGAARIPT